MLLYGGMMVLIVAKKKMNNVENQERVESRRYSIHGSLTPIFFCHFFGRRTMAHCEP
jgi:hypothetical protein